jgi:GNAT superfamily N-acetyltransferase
MPEPYTPEAVRIVPANEASWEDLLEMLRRQTSCGVPDAQETSGLLAYVDGQPAGWVALEPRTAYPKLRTSRVPWSGRQEDKDDGSVWAVTCLVVRPGFRGRGLTYLLAQATIAFASSRGARALEAYGMTCQVFEEAGFTEVSSPSLRRRVLRVEFR